MTYQDLTYNRTYKYPRWALTFGWFLSVSSLICIPSYAVFAFLKAKGSFKNVTISFLFLIIYFHIFIECQDRK